MPIDSKRIAKNTVMLYARMLLILLCNLFVVRVVLNALGATDFGINNVVGGVVLMFTFLTSTMNAASQRFFSFELGRQDEKRLSECFLITLWGYIGIAVFVFVVAETAGIWFVQNKLTIPPDRLSASIWVFQCSVISFIVNIVALPYNAVIIAREKMNVYAYVGIFEVLLKLAVAYMLYAYSGDRLKLYAILLCIVMSLPSLFYIVYVTLNFPESRIRKFWNKSLFMEIFSYSSWNLFGAVASILRSQGVNILLNMFFGPLVNASRAIAYQVLSAINQFVLNFVKAVQPQIVKSYAADERDQMLQLVYSSTKYCFFLLYIIAVPIFVGMPYVLAVWLKNVPTDAVLFTRLIIILAMIESTVYSLQTALMSTGKIKIYQMVTGCMILLNLPLSWLCFSMGGDAAFAFYISIIIAFVSQIVRMIFMKKMLLMPIKVFFIKVVFPILAVCALGVPLIKLFSYYIVIESIGDFLLFAILSISVTLLCCFSVGMTNVERMFLKKILLRRLGK